MASPEALVAQEWTDFIRKSPELMNIVFDEAHCISDWLVYHLPHLKYIHFVVPCLLTCD